MAGNWTGRRLHNNRFPTFCQRLTGSRVLAKINRKKKIEKKISCRRKKCNRNCSSVESNWSIRTFSSQVPACWRAAGCHLNHSARGSINPNFHSINPSFSDQRHLMDPWRLAWHFHHWTTKFLFPDSILARIFPNERMNSIDMIFFHVTDAVGRKPVILTASVLFIAGSVTMGIADGLWPLLIGRIIVGIGIGKFSNVTLSSPSVPSETLTSFPSNSTSRKKASLFECLLARS